MNLLNKLTIKNLKLNKKRTIVTIIGIMLSVALITAVASIYNSGVKSLISFETYERGNFHVAYYDVSEEEIKVLNNNREIENLSLTKDIGYAKVDSKNEYKPYAFIKAFTNDSLKNLSIKLVKGRLPENNEEILIPTHLLSNGRLELKVGSEITLDVGSRIGYDDVILNQSNPYQKGEELIDTTPKTYKIVGVIERPATNIESYSAPGYTFVTLANENDLKDNLNVYARYTKEGTKHAYALTANILGVDATLFEKYYKSTATNEEIIKFMTEETSKKINKININTYLIQLENDPLGLNSTGGLIVVVGIVIGIIIFTSVFCIKNSFDISITEKTKQYGMLRSVGATKKQIKKNVFYEALVLGLIGIPLGILAGLIASYILIIISNYYLSNSLAPGLKLHFVISFVAILIAIVLGAITIYLSALKSAKRASSVSPIDSIRNSANIKIKAKKLKAPKFIEKIFGIGGEISYKNLKRNKKKYRTTVISIAVSVFVFIALFSFMSLSFAAIRSELNLMEYNLSLSSSSVDNQNTYQKFVETTKLDNIEDYTFLRQTGAQFGNKKLNPEYVDFLNIKVDQNDIDVYLSIYALGDEQYRKFIKELGLDYDEISDKAILMDYMTIGRQKTDNTNKKKTKMVYKTMRYTDYQKGEIISGLIADENKFEIEIGYITDKKPFGLMNSQDNYIIVSDKVFDNIKESDLNKVIEVYFKSNNAAKLQDSIDELLKGENYNVNNLEEYANMMNRLYTLIGIFLYGFIIVISLIGITNIFNTITTNMELRRQEFAMLKSIGMTSKEFRRMIHLETFFMGMKSLLFGLPIGLILSYIIYIFLGKDMGLPYELPILAIIIAVGVVFILISLIMRYSMNKINKQNVIETIRNENI